MRQRFAKFVYPLRLPFILAVWGIVAMTSQPAESHSHRCTRFWEYDYYYDAAHTQWAGHCAGSCDPGGAWCTGVITDYYVRYGGDYCGTDCFNQ